jgi:flagellar M-ring protein FliF
MIVALVVYGSQPEYGVLFSDLKTADAQAIIDKLKAASVPYKLSQGGTTVSVPGERVAEMRVQMAAAGALSGGHVGFDIFDKSSFGATDFAQRVNYQRALAGELARTLEGMDEVESARVHITPPRESVFTEKAERGKASVVLRMRQNRELSRERTEAVLNLVASAVEGLDPGDVSVMDTRGRVLSAAGRNHSSGTGGEAAFNSHLEARQRLESETAERIVSLLEPITGSGHVRANVTADLDFSQIEQTEEKYNPQSAVIRSQQTSQESRNSGASGIGGLVGARANNPSTNTPPAAPTASPSPAASQGTPPAPLGDQRTASTTNYEIDKTIKRTVNNGGRITRLSVSVVVDDKIVNGAATARTPEELKKMQDLVTAAVGIDASRGDQVVVQTIPFEKAVTESGPLTWLERYRDLIKMGIKYGALIFAVFLLLIFVVRPAKRALKAAATSGPHLLPAGTVPALAPAPNQQRIGDTTTAASSASQPTPASQATESAPARTVAELQAEMLAEMEREEAKAVEMKRSSTIQKRLAERSQREPETVAMTIRSWLQES